MSSTARGWSRPAMGLALALLVQPPCAWAGEDEGEDAPGEEEEVDHVELAAVLVADGHYDRAAAVLDEVDIDAEGVDLARYWMLYGLVELNYGRNEQAAEKLESSIEAGQEEPIIWVFLAQAYFGLEEFDKTIEALDQAGDVADDLAGSFLIRAQCHWRRDDKTGAWAALDAGHKRHPDDLEIQRNLVMLLIEMGLYQQARIEGQKMLLHEDTVAEDHVAIAEALRRSNQHQQAILVLEWARLLYPGNEKILKQMAQTYLDVEMPLTAARLLHEAAWQNPALLVEVAELYRRAGKLQFALHVNEQVPDQKAKARQKLGLLIELENYEQAAAMKPRLSRLGLLDDENIRYAVAYAYYRNGQMKEAEDLLEGIQDPVLYEKSIELRRAIEVCRQSGWLCL